MKFGEQDYIPCLRWKQGEYQAIYRLSPAAKEMIVPLIEVAEIGYDFETRKENKSVDEHLKSFAKRVKDKWGRRECFVDIHLIDSSKRMADGRNPMVFVFDDLRAKGIQATPVIGIDPDPDHLLGIRNIITIDNRGICIRIGIEATEKSDIGSSLDSLNSECGVGYENSDLIIDLRAPRFEPIDIFTRILVKRINNLPNLNRWRSFTLIGTSFPASMAEVPSGYSIIPRYEWRLYKMLVPLLRRSGLRIPTFGDYAINHPKVLHLDMRLVKPYASLRYTIDDSWLMVRGRNVRDYKYGQYRDLCRIVVESKHYSGQEYSKGDDYIYRCAQGKAKTGNLTTWRWVGTNHHVEMVARDVANFASASNTP